LTQNYSKDSPGRTGIPINNHMNENEPTLQQLHQAFVYMLKQCEDRGLLSTSYMSYLWAACRQLEKKVLIEQGLASDWVQRTRAKKNELQHAAFAIRAKALEDPEQVKAALEAFAALSASQGLNTKNTLEGNENDTE
jgi:hypothetical protein